MSGFDSCNVNTFDMRTCHTVWRYLTSIFGVGGLIANATHGTRDTTESDTDSSISINGAPKRNKRALGAVVAKQETPVTPQTQATTLGFGTNPGPRNSCTSSSEGWPGLADHPHRHLTGVLPGSTMRRVDVKGISTPPAYTPTFAGPSAAGAAPLSAAVLLADAIPLVPGAVVVLRAAPSAILVSFGCRVDAQQRKRPTGILSMSLASGGRRRGAFSA